MSTMDCTGPVCIGHEDKAAPHSAAPQAPHMTLLQLQPDTEAVVQLTPDVDPSGLPEVPSESAAPTVLGKLQKWGDYASVGQPVPPTKFVPMKTPLSEAILAGWSLPTQPKHRLTVAGMLREQEAAGRHVGLILDLSNHDCLYTEDIPQGVDYKHIHLVAKLLPPPEFVQRVCAAASEFWQEHPDEYIAIHCAYGFNRTGFVVCCYLIEMCGLSVDEALQAFATARPPGVKHEAFRNELHRRYDSEWSEGQGPGQQDQTAATEELPVVQRQPSHLGASTQPGATVEANGRQPSQSEAGVAPGYTPLMQPQRGPHRIARTSGGGPRLAMLSTPCSLLPDDNSSLGGSLEARELSNTLEHWAIADTATSQQQQHSMAYSQLGIDVAAVSYSAAARAHCLSPLGCAAPTPASSLGPSSAKAGATPGVSSASAFSDVVHSLDHWLGPEADEHLLAGQEEDGSPGVAVGPRHINNESLGLSERLVFQALRNRNKHGGEQRGSLEVSCGSTQPGVAAEVGGKAQPGVPAAVMQTSFRRVSLQDIHWGDEAAAS